MMLEMLHMQIIGQDMFFKNKEIEVAQIIADCLDKRDDCTFSLLLIKGEFDVDNLMEQKISIPKQEEEDYLDYVYRAYDNLLMLSIGYDKAYIFIEHEDVGLAPIILAYYPGTIEYDMAYRVGIPIDTKSPYVVKSSFIDPRARWGYRN